MKKQAPSIDSFTFYNLPKRVKIGGRFYPIRWDFTAALRFMEYVDTSEDEDETFLQRVLEIWYPEIPNDRDEALTQAVRFYCGGTLPEEGYYAPLFSPQEKREGIYLYFLNQYGIDLNTDTVHWWVFRKLLERYKKGGNYGI
ncbi:MAG: hypothetical protein J6B86_05250 [Clostridia bacterium]|nr:hypothetical protein [Clostridia bacterium]